MLTVVLQVSLFHGFPKVVLTYGIPIVPNKYDIHGCEHVQENEKKAMLTCTFIINTFIFCDKEK